MQLKLKFGLSLNYPIRILWKTYILETFFEAVQFTSLGNKVILIARISTCSIIYKRFCINSIKLLNVLITES